MPMTVDIEYHASITGAPHREATPLQKTHLMGHEVPKVPIKCSLFAAAGLNGQLSIFGYDPRQ